MSELLDNGGRKIPIFCLSFHTVIQQFTHRLLYIIKSYSVPEISFFSLISSRN